MLKTNQTEPFYILYIGSSAFQLLNKSGLAERMLTLLDDKCPQKLGLVSLLPLP